MRDVVIPNWLEVFDRFIREHPSLQPRLQRDFERLVAVIKEYALLNCFARKSLEKGAIIANETDVEAGFRLYNHVATANELGLSPEVYDIYMNVIKPSILEEPTSVGRKAISRVYCRVYHRALLDEKLRREILPTLESAVLIRQELNLLDRREMLVFSAE